jgi:geranylgeranyl diphosphate synthase, type I
MNIDHYFEVFLPEIELALQQIVAQARQPGLEEMHFILAYHMGWEGQGAGPEARGKRIRPLLVLLACAAAGGEWRSALPGAAAVELVHNFSLLHDDIQDKSPLRRGRPTAWTLWGVAQAINAGDTLFTLGQMALLDLSETVTPQAALDSSRILQETCLALTQGQYLDLAYETRQDLTEAAYWPMIDGKTAALLSACTRIGASSAQASPQTCQAYGRFGQLLGLAFQAQDDLLGIWGDAALTGKSTESDLVSAKKSLPVLYGLGMKGAFARRWNQGNILASEVQPLAAQLEAEGARQYTQEQADRLTGEALAALAQANPHGEAGAALTELAQRLLARAA